MSTQAHAVRAGTAPSLDDLLAHPERVVALAPEVAAELAHQVVDLRVRADALHMALVVRALIGTSQHAGAEAEQWLGVPEVSTRLGLTKSYVYELLRTGLLPGRRVGKYWRVRLSVLQEWESDRVNPPRAEPSIATGSIRKYHSS